MPKSFLCRSQYFSRFGAPKTHCWGKRRPLLGLLLIRRPIHLGLNSFLTVATLFSRIPSSTLQPPRSTRSSSTLEPCAAAANLWAPPPTFVDRRAAPPPPIICWRVPDTNCCCVVIFGNFR